MLTLPPTFKGSVAFLYVCGLVKAAVQTSPVVTKVTATDLTPACGHDRRLTEKLHSWHQRALKISRPTSYRHKDIFRFIRNIPQSPLSLTQFIVIHTL